ncbi:MAG: hypothetical protein HQL41_04990 [Alphaproteobacteria bacterium]|nr:hypothetical protein [Alphaproteobacteria bacterium]
MTGSPPPALTVRKIILANYVDSLSRVCRHFKVAIDEANYSECELRLALEEAEIDVEALIKRRSPEDGVSIGKVAGAYAYRLSRFQILHFSEAAYEMPTTFLIQNIVALNVVKARILRMKIGDGRTLELAYQMSRRHANQETLGFCFDVMLEHAT